MATRVYGKVQYATHRTHNVACEVCGGTDELQRVQYADTRMIHARGSNRTLVKSWWWDIERDARALDTAGMTRESWSDKRVCSVCYAKFSKIINS